MKNSIYRKSIFTFLILFFTLVLSQSALAAQIKLAWDANTESDLAGYKVYYGTSSKSYSGSVDAGNVTAYTLDWSYSRTDLLYLRNGLQQIKQRERLFR